MKTNHKHLFLGFFLAILLVAALWAANLNQPTQTRTKAAGSTTLTLVPAAATKQTGDTIDLDMMVDPGTNLVSTIKFQITFDSSKIALITSNPFTLNAAAFPVKVEGPVLNSESIGVTVSVGADPTKVIQTTAKVGTLHFKAVGGTGSTPTKISFTNLTQAFSTGSNDSPRQNVLSGTSPANITIGGGSTTVTPNPSSSPTITPVPSGKITTATFTLLLHGVGSAGDNPNPRGSNLSNKSPLHPQRNLQVSVFNSANQPVSTVSGAINYDAGSGTFKGRVNLGANITQDNYSIKIKTDRYLRKLVPGSLKLTPLKDNSIPKVELVAGDTNGDNFVNIIDYNAFLDCGYGRLNPLPMNDANSIFNKKICQTHKPAELIDVDDNGIIDSTDYNLFLRELSVLTGD